MPDLQLLESVYGGQETFQYEITWLGIKAGELIIHIERMPEEPDSFRVTILANTAGLLAVFYPVEDRFETIVQGRERLPVRLDFWQEEGKRKNYRLTVYDQEEFTITYTKNDMPPIIYEVGGPVHNEFSSFLALRIMPLQVGRELIVPTFADKKRHEVKVMVEKKKKMRSIFGEVETTQVRPHLNFKGLYEKLGDPIIWFTDDQFRIPIRIKAKIVIGSFSAKLVSYQGLRAVPVAQQAPAP